jgi:hypothetical protein
MKKFFNKVYYRVAAAIITTAAKGGSYPDYTFSGWTLLVGGVAEAKTGIEPDGDEPIDGGATIFTSGEKSPLEISVIDFSAANYATIRSAFLNQKVDVLLVDSDQPAVGYAVHGIRLHPALDTTSGAEPKIVLKGERKYGAGVTTPPFQLVAIS